MKLLKRYKHILIIPAYAVFYLLGFFWLENKVTKNYHIIHMPLDDMIPFCEYFVIPYFLWFAFIAVALIYFGFFNKDLKEYYQLAFNLGIGMTLFLIISYIYPNGQDLRPETFANDNIFTQMVQYLYSIDTPTNVFPSIHVYNSVAVAIAFMTCRKLQKHPAVRYGTVALAISIVLATMFLKQHSICDVVAGITFSFATYILLYRAFAKISMSVTRSPKIKVRPYPVFSRSNNSKETAN